MKPLNLYIFILFICFYSQIYSQINPPIPNPKKIIFTYKTVPNFHFENNGVYADTFLLKKEFPRIKYILKKSPIDSTKVVGYISKTKFNPEEIRSFSSLIFHSFTEINNTYNTKSKITNYNGSICKSDDCKKIFRVFFNDIEMDGTDIFSSSIIFKDKKFLIINTGNSFYNKINYKDNLIKWTDYENFGVYSYISKEKNYNYTNLVEFDVKLDKHVSPIKLFSNCEYGVKETISKYTTTTLISVTYE